MAVTTPPTISALPTPPSTSDPATFDTRADAFMASLPTHTTETNAASANVYANAVDAAANATAAGNSATSASNSAATAVAAAGATLWISGTTYTLGATVISPINLQLYRRSIAGAGTTDPSLDPTNWVRSIVGLSVVAVSGTTQTAALGYSYSLNNVAATTVTAPTSFAAGDSFAVIPNNGLATNVIDFGAKTVRGPAGTATGTVTLDAGAAMTLVAISNSIWAIL